MLTYKKLTQINGFDIKNPSNAKQNSYAWSMAELGDYIYVGTSRNMFTSISGSFRQGNILPSLMTGKDNNAEIWRYKKDGSCPWQKVFKTDPSDKDYGFRIMTTHKSKHSCAIYAASIGENIHVYKSCDGVHWIKLYTSNLVGQSSRAMVSFNGRLYISTLDSGIGGKSPYLYSSTDPEYEPFRPVIYSTNHDYNPDKNPHGGIDDIQVFNNRLYLCTSTDNGCEIWRSDNVNPKTNDWTLVADKGFGDAANKNVMSTGVFKNHLYIAVTKILQVSLFAPFGFDLIRIDKNDNWEVVVGGKPLVPSCPSKGKRTKSISGFNSGFNSFFNVYGWQIAQFNGSLIITTFDNSINIKTIYDNYIYNKDNYVKMIGNDNYSRIVESYSKILFLLDKYKYPKGFDIYTSNDGCHFTPSILKGLNNPYNYGGRKLLVSCENNLYIGTANPYCGCEIWEAFFSESTNTCSSHKVNSYFENLNKLNHDLLEIYPVLIKGFDSMLNLQNNTATQ